MAALPENDRITGPFFALAGQTDFPADFPLIKADGLRVRRQRDGEADVILEGVAVSAVDLADNGFTCRLAAGSVAGDRIWVFSQLPAARERAHINGGAVRTPTLEGDAVEAQAQLQELRRDLSLSVTVAPGETPPTSAQLKALAEGIDGVIELAEAAGAAAAEGKANKAGDAFSGPVSMPELDAAVARMETGGFQKNTFGIFGNAAAGYAIANEPAGQPQVVGFTTPSQISTYPDRDSVAWFASNMAPALLQSVGTVSFTSATVLLAAPARADVKVGMLVDTTNVPKYSGQITAISPNRLTLTVSGWFQQGNAAAGQVPSGTPTLQINPITKVWAQNSNVIITPDSFAGRGAGFELGVLNVKGPLTYGDGSAGPTGGDNLLWGMDVVSLGTFQGGVGYIQRGNFLRGYVSNGASQYGFVVEDTTQNPEFSFGSIASTGKHFSSAGGGTERLYIRAEDSAQVGDEELRHVSPQTTFYGPSETSGVAIAGGATLDAAASVTAIGEGSAPLALQGRNVDGVAIGQIVAPGGVNGIAPAVAGEAVSGELVNGTEDYPWAGVAIQPPNGLPGPGGKAGQYALSAPASYQKIYLENVPGIVEGSGGDAEDNAAALNAYILSKNATGFTVYLRSRGRYNMHQRLLFRGIDNVHFVCEGPDRAILYFPAAGLTNTYAAGGSTYYAVNAAPIHVRERLSGDGGGPAVNITFQGIHIECEPAPTASRLLRPFSFRGVKNLKVYDCAASGFGMGRAFAFESILGDSEADGLHVFDTYDNSTYATSPQMTAVEIDNNITALGPTTQGFKIRNIRAEGMTLGPDLLAAWGYQTDAVHFVNGNTRNVTLDGLYADGVGEGIDYYGDGLKATNLTFVNNKIFAMTIKRGGRNAQFENFTATGTGLQAIRVEGADERLVENNSFSRGKISGIDPDFYWGGAETACVNISDLTRTNRVTRTSITDVEMDPGTNGKHGWLSTGTNTDNFGENIRIAPVNPGLAGYRVRILDGVNGGAVRLRGTTTFEQNVA